MKTLLEQKTKKFLPMPNEKNESFLPLIEIMGNYFSVKVLPLPLELYIFAFIQQLH